MPFIEVPVYWFFSVSKLIWLLLSKLNENELFRCCLWLFVCLFVCPFFFFFNFIEEMGLVV